MRRFFAAPALALVMCLAVVAPAAASRPRVAVGDRAQLTHGASLTGAVDPGRRLRITIGLQSRDPLGLRALAQAVATPGSREFGRFLTVRRFARRFGAPASALTTVRRALRADGLSVVRTYADHLSLLATGRAGTIERAFATRLSDVRLLDGRRTLVNTTAPTLPAGLGDDVAAVLGLDGLAAPRPLGLDEHPAAAVPPGGRPPARAEPRTAGIGPQPCAAATTAANPGAADGVFGYTAPLLAAAYGVPSLYAAGDFGQGQKVAVYETESLNPADIAAFQACYGTAARVSLRPVDTPDPVDHGPSGDGEAALDVEQVISMAPQASVLVYEASQTDLDGNSALLSSIASQDAAKTVTISYGLCESLVGKAGAAYEARLFQEMAVQGQSVFASSGDSGSESCSDAAGGGGGSPGLSVSDPASQPTVTGVGGTSLYSGSASAPTAWTGAGALTEGLWNSGSYTDAAGTVASAGSGGGLSDLWAMPAYQSTATAALGVVKSVSGTGICGATSCREVPDVSADGDPQTGAVVYENNNPDGAGASSWQLAGGTSESAPLWAGFAALTDAQPSCRTLSVGDLNPSLYALASKSYGTYFRDVDAASAFTSLTTNDVTGTSGGAYPVGPGYDLATGLGSPLLNALAPALCALRAPVYRVSVQNPGTVHVVVHRRTKLTVTATDSGKVALSYTATGLPPGMKLDSTTGVIRGTPRTSGRFRVTVAASDFAGNAGRARFTLISGGPTATISQISLAVVTTRQARLAFTVMRPVGRRLRSVTIRLPARSGLSWGRLRGTASVTTASGRRERRLAFRLAEHRGAVTIRFTRPQTRVRVDLTVGSIRVSRPLERRAKRHGATVRIPLSATDTTRHISRETARVVVMAARHRHSR